MYRGKSSRDGSEVTRGNTAKSRRRSADDDFARRGELLQTDHDYRRLSQRLWFGSGGEESRGRTAREAGE